MSSNGHPHSAPNGLEHPPLDRDGLDRGMADMRERIRRHAAPVPVAITIPDFEVQVQVLIGALNALNPVDSGGPVDRAVVVHYGLDAGQAFDIALEFVALEAQKGKRPYIYKATGKGGLFRPVDGALVAVEGGAASWYGPGGSGANYAAAIRIQRSTGSGWSEFLPGHDVTRSYCPFEWHLELLIANNGLSGTDRLRVIPIAGPSDWQFDAAGAAAEYDHRQGCAWVAVDHWPTNDPVSPDAAFTDRGADLVSPCPPHCVRVSFRETGIARRP